jgi:hypothetical protein
MLKLKKLQLLILFLAVVWLIGCHDFHPVEQSPRTARIEEKHILGKWQLKNVETNSPDKIDVESWQIEFLKGGSWKCSGLMNGHYQDMTREDYGTYQISDNVLIFTTKEGAIIESKIEIQDRLLILAPDPNIHPRGSKDEVVTIYQLTN